VAKAVRESLPPSLLGHWQEAVTLALLVDGEKKLGDCRWFDLWRQSYAAACAAVDDELCRSRRLDAVHSGSTALSVVKQGDLMVFGNVGDSRAVLATTADDGAVAAVQLTVDFKPNLPRKASLFPCEFASCDAWPRSMSDIVCVEPGLLQRRSASGGATAACAASPTSRACTACGCRTGSRRDWPCRARLATTASRTTASSRRRR
jgi:hypothetical protein